jgi:serine protease
VGRQAAASALDRRLAALVALLCLVALLVAPTTSSAAQPQAEATAAAKQKGKAKRGKGKGKGKAKRGGEAAKLRRNLNRLARAVRRSGYLPRRQRRRLRRLVLSSKRRLNPRRACIAYKRLFSVQRALAKGARRARRARRAARRRQAKLDRRIAKIRIRVLRLRPDGKGCGGPATFAVDGSAKPARKALPKLGGRRRPLARVVNSDGSAADFVANEIIVQARNRKQLRRVLRRWRGKVLGKAAVPGKADTYLVRIRRAGNPLGLPADVRKLSKTRGTSTLVSSGRGLGTLAAVADEAARGRAVGLNWVGAGDGYVEGFTSDSPTGPPGFNVSGGSWSRDAYDWIHLAGGGPQDTGVAPSWTLLAKLGRLRPNSIRVGILDMGFAPVTNGDVQPSAIALTNLPGAAPVGTPNLLSCSGGFSCPWHGTGVHNAAMGVPDNGVGAAGPAGPVAQPVLIFTLYDFFTGISATTAAAAAGAKVINMSYGADVPAAFSWSVAPFEATTGALRAAGVLLFAAAGNSATDVDSTDCFGVCWEGTLHTPCENLGVICVGATDTSTAPACYSNWGTGGGVDIWAPGTIPVGPDPGNGAPVRGVNGTSVASPYAAGVAALAWAGEPAASANAVERALTGHGRPGGARDTDCGGDSVDNHMVDRFIHPLATIRDLLPPDAAIQRPSDGGSFQRGTPVTFEAFVYDDGLGSPTVRWTRSGSSTPIGTGERFTKSDLPVGHHTVTMTARFPGGAVVTDRVELTIANHPPRVEIVSPPDGTEFFESQTAKFRGQSVDANEAGGTLADSQVRWYLDGSGTSFATGHEVTRALSDLSPGSHTVTFRGDDGTTTDEDSITIVVNEDPPDPPPQVFIDSPTNGQVFNISGTSTMVSFDTTATDNGPVTYEWSDRINGGPPQALATTEADPTLKLDWVESSCFDNTQHDVTVKVTDESLSTSEDTVRVFISQAIC